MKAIILAGGLGTRLRPIIGEDIPKCMAPVMGRPMVTMAINSLKNQGITDITLALGYKAEAFLDKFAHMKYKIEDEPLGTGGAIKHCLEGKEPVLVMNGDTVAAIDYHDMRKKYTVPLTIALDAKGQSAGIYILDPEIFDAFPQKVFSFEKDVIPKIPHTFYHIDWFTDLGTPDAYNKVPKGWV